MEAGVGAVELEGELIVPVQVAKLALLQADAVGGAVGVLELWYADVDVEVFFQRGVGLDGNFFQHQPAGLGADRDDRLRRAAEQDLHAVVALGHRDGEEEGLVGRAGPVLHLRSGPQVPVPAGRGLGVEGVGEERDPAVLPLAAGEGHRPLQRRRHWKRGLLWRGRTPRAAGAGEAGAAAGGAGGAADGAVWARRDWEYESKGEKRAGEAAHGFPYGVE